MEKRIYRHCQNCSGNVYSYKAKICRECYLMDKNHLSPSKKLYCNAHHKVKKERGQPDKCDHCGTTVAKRFEWANLTKNYSDIWDYVRLCASCHHTMDGTIKNIPLMKGEKHPNAKLKDGDIPLILELLTNSKMTLRRIGEIFNVSISNIANIKKGRSYKHLIS